MTSEERYGVDPQPKETCPMIDALQTDLASAYKTMRNYQKSDDVEELKEMLSDIEHILFSWSAAHSSLEEIRTHVVSIRDWGQQWKENFIELKESQS